MNSGCLGLIFIVVVTSLTGIRGDGVVSFVDTSVSVSESPGSAVLKVRRTGGTNGIIYCSCKISNASAQEDFDNIDDTVTFNDGDITDKECSFTIKDDEIPEGNEIFTVKLEKFGVGNGTVGDPKEATITILANDKAYGVIGFSKSGTVDIQEPLSPSQYNIELFRSIGVYGAVSVNWQIDNVVNDFVNTTGTIHFGDGQQTAVLPLEVKPDNIAENAEVFTIRLTSPKGGAELNASFTDLQIRIPANDAAVRFPLRHIEVPENQTSIQIQVNRGLQSDGITVVGNVNEVVDIHWFVVPGNAHPGKDFQNKNDTLTFASGATKGIININIINDATPELAENFTIHLTTTSSSVFIVPDGVATVTILANDDQHGVIMFGSFPSQLDEDNTNSGTFVVNRTKGTFRTVSVSWSIVAANGASLVNVFDTTSGSLTFNTGESRKDINIVVKQDNTPEEASEFYVELSNPTGGSRLGNTLEARRALFYVKDSDDAYGIVEFADLDHQDIIRDKSPRVLSLTLVRNGGTLRSISVNYTVEYYLPSSNTPSNSLGFTSNDQVTFVAGQTNKTFAVAISNDGFIRLGSVFKVVLNDCKLLGAAPVVVPSTPKLGSNSVLYLNVTTTDADGEIGFAKVHPTLTVKEPIGVSPSIVRLVVVRDGTAERATADWSLDKSSGDLTSSDAGPSNGTIVFEKGQESVNLTLKIYPDDLPELDEVFTVTLSNVVSPNKLQTGMDTATITIDKNDNPGGTFVIENTTPIVKKEGEVITIDVVRLGSALDERKVVCQIVPNGGADFTGSTKILTFKANEYKKQATIFVKNDNTPELDERFQLILVASGPAETRGTLGNATVVNITIVQNEDPYGIVEFATADLIKRIDERKNTNTSVTLTINRNKGTFGSTDVVWEILGNQKPSLDLYPTQGVATFNEGDASKTFHVYVLHDVIPESNETFIINLKSLTGQAKFGAQLNATVIVTENDDPVYFESPTSVNVTEGQTANLTIRRGGDGQSSITVTYKTFDGTAQASDSDYVSADGKVIFGPGEMSKEISITTRDDDKPEGVEFLTVKLINVTGDTVIQNGVATITIYASDAGTGVFQFVDDGVKKSLSETDSVTFDVARLLAQHGKVHVFYQILRVHLNGSLTQLSPGVDFVPSSGFIEFNDKQDKGAITIKPFDDTIAEMNETFAVQIVNATGINTGEDGRLGNVTTQYFTVLPNDDPNGVFRLDDSSKDIKIPEDYPPGEKNTTEKKVTVVRDQGLWGDTQALWEISTAANNIIQLDPYDLLFLSNFGSGVMNEPSRRRANTGTNVSCFSSSRAGSHATVSLFGGETLTELSISSWLLPEKQSLGYLLSYNVNNRVELEVSLNTTGSSSSIYLSLFDGNGTADLGKNIADGKWHEIVITITLTGKLVTFYVDGDKLITWSSFTGRSLTGGGLFTVGSSDSSKSSYTGCVQDVRVYKANVEASKVTEMFKPILDLTPINGYLSFESNVRQQSIKIETVDDLKPEDEQQFRIGLISAKGGARLDKAKASTTLTVLKSDNANGLFGFDSTAPITMSETSNNSFTVDRKKGTSGQVTVDWAVYKYGVSGLELASKDFIRSQGNLVFIDGDTQEVFFINPNDDSYPELDEHFVLRLVSTRSNDGKISSTPTSGASVDPNFTEINITIVKNDQPYGLLQFMDAVPPGNATIPPAVETYHKDIRESTGSVDLIVVRAQGLQGNIKVSWRIQPKTAKAPEDYIDGAGDLTFLPGETSATINIKLVDDDIPELNKTFEVELYNPTGGAELSPLAKVAIVTILPSDDAFGVMNFTQDSVQRLVNESSTTSLSILRSGGALGLVTVYWKVIGPNLNDVTPMEGSVDLTTGQRSATIRITIADDVQPELSESYIVTLVNVTKGRLALSGITSNITIRPSDHPYGVFIFRPAVLSTNEENKTIHLLIQRQYGSYGIVKVYYKSLNFGDSVANVKQSATPGEDFIGLSGSLVFDEGVENVTITVQLRDDETPEDLETILVRLTKVEIVKHSAVVPVPVNSPVLGRDSLAQIRIKRNDNASGIVQLTSTSVQVTEPYSHSIVNATRSAGAFGKVVIDIAVASGTASSSDYRLRYTNITFQDGQRIATVPLEIVDDQDPEKVESFTIKLLPTGIQGGAVLGYPRECVVTIEENDYPYGLIGIDAGFLNVIAYEPTNKVQIKVIRTYGSEGASIVHWEATYNGQSPNKDITPVRGDLVFPSGSDQSFREKYIEIEILGDDIPEIPEVIQVTLINVTSGKAAINANARNANLTIAANDDPHGVVEFTQSSYIAIEGTKTSKMAYLEVSRKSGSFGILRLYYSTKLLPGSNITNQDFMPIANGSITIPNGQTTANITITILHDTIPELNEIFTVVLEAVELIGQSSKSPPRLGSLREANVTILSNDDANGRFMIRAIDAGSDSDGSVKTVLEQVTSVGFEIIRTGGTIGSVSVKWTIDASSTATSGNDFQGDGATLDFGPGETKKTAIVQILQDGIPEIDETIVITLVNPTNGATVTTGRGSNLTIVISANDRVAGLVGFGKSYQSIVTREGSNITLEVERTQPAAGRVKVLWAIHGTNASHDFVPYSGDVIFLYGQTNANITFRVRSDSTPEPDELFLVKLSNISTYDIAESGAAELILDQISATLSVQASDEPHGVIEFQSASRDFTTDEANKTVTLVLTRLHGTIGSLRVYYEIKPGNITALKQGEQLASENDFKPTASSIDIRNGESVGQIPVQILDENIPEIDEVFVVNITRVTLISSPFNTSGQAPKLGKFRAAQVRIKSNDNPRGLLGFTRTQYYVNETTKAYDVIVERTQGTLGTITVEYYIKGNTAIEGTDFVVPANPGGEKTLTFVDGQRTQNITVDIKDDKIPEDDELFRIHLKESEANTLRSGYTVAVVVIVANDDARGVFSFENVKQTISEPGNGADTSASFTVVRKVALLGQVVVGWRVLNDSAAMDLSPISGNITFDEKDNKMTFTINSLLDSTPEKDEIFTIGLSIISSTGGRLSSPSTATLIIAENDYPYGELEIVSTPSLSSSISVEENSGIIKARVRRTKGNYGRIEVSYQTTQGTALSPTGDVEYFETIQGLKTVGANSWYSFKAYGDQYLLLASNSSGDRGDYVGSSLYRWQGVFTKVQSISTNGAVNWHSIVINDVTYLAVANYGEDGRTEIKSSVYRLDKNGHVISIQNISTIGASDVKFFQHGGKTYLVFANSKKNNLDTVVNSKVYIWQSGSFVDQNADFETRAASGLAVLTINGDLLLAVSSFYNKAANSFSTNSPILKWTSGSFQPYKEVSTNGPIGVQYFKTGGEHFLVFGNSKGHVTVHQWKTDKFELVQSIVASNVKSLYTYTLDGKAHFCTVDNDNDIKIYSWNTKFELQMNATVSHINSAYPMVITDPVAGEVQLVAAAVSGSAVSPVIRPVKLSSIADFIPRKGQLIFENGQTELDLDFTILQDSTPEKDESFSIALSNATGKAVIGSKSSLTVTILSNNNAYGRIGFSQNSLQLIQPEEDTVVNFEVVREYGLFGRVVVLWNATGDYREGQISPVSGAMVFEVNESTQNISIRLRNDDIPELDKVITIRLLALNETGSSQPGRGATINTARALATLTIPGNDDPYGVIGWRSIHYLSQEAIATNKTVTMTIRRTGGLIGSVAVHYETHAPARPLHSNEQSAVAGVDYVSKRGQVVMASGVNATDIDIEILHGHLTTINKVLFINITAVSLQPGSPSSPLVSNSPRINLEARLLEVIISQTNQSLGEINFNVSSTRIHTTEGSTVTLMLVRNGSLSDRVGLRYVVRPSISHSVAPASRTDFSPDNGTVYFEDGERIKTIDIRVIDDGIPEISEEFYVEIVSPINSVTIGRMRRVDVEIQANDDPSGVFGFMLSPLEAGTVKEGEYLRLEVFRRAGSFGNVKVTWQLDRKTSQITPNNGTLMFKQGVRSMFIVLFAVDDSIPEDTQQFTCSLVNADNNGKLNASRKSTNVIIPANDNALGVISIDPSTRNLLVGEPMDNGYNGVFNIRILRKIGQVGTAKVSWKITRETASASSPSDTFNASSGVLTFTDGIKSLPITLKVEQDSNPEEFASYSLEIFADGAQADNSSGALKATIDVAASDSPYGVIVFGSPWSYNISEDVGFVNVTVIRNNGDIGQLKVNFTIASSTASDGDDFTASSTHLEFTDKEHRKELYIQIIDDAIPELTERISLRIQSVVLVPSRPMNFTTIHGLQPDEPPKIGEHNTINIDIIKNDDAHGVVQFRDTSKTIHEEDKQVVLLVERKGGALGDVEVAFIVHNGTATVGQDYTISKGSIVFKENQNLANITIPIIDDSEPEQQETFTVTLTSVSGGAILGGQKSSNVVILISDNPSGLLGFVNATELVTANPNVTKSLTFGIARNGGAQGAITVKWKLERVKPTIGNLSQDFFPPYHGIISYSNGNKNTQFVNIRLDAYKEPEPEEKYLIQLHDVTGGADIDLLKSNITITVLKHGFPNGIFKFKDTTHRTVDEPDTGKTYALSLPIERTIGFQGDVKVYWKAVGASTQDLVRTSGEVTFNAGVALRNLQVGVKGDDVPELNESFTIMLYAVDGGADLDTSAQNVTVTIRANDDPHGILKLKPNAQSLEVVTLSRTLQFTVLRDKGAFGDVTVDYSVTYSSWYPRDLSGSLVIRSGSKEFTKKVSLLTSAFLDLNSNFRVTLTGVRYSSSGSPAVVSSPKLASSSISETVMVHDSAANAVLRFADNSLKLTINADNSATITVLRQGFYGDVSVTWKMGYPPDAIPSGYSAGQIEPDTGALVFNGQANNQSFTVKAKQVIPDRKLFYAVHLSKTTTSSNIAANITTGAKRTAVIEYSGIIQIAPDAMSLVVTEGKKVSCRAVRLFSVFGSVRVTYEAMGTSGAFNMADGEFSKSFEVTSPDNNIPERDYTFFINITQVTGTGSPRLGTKTVSTVTVKDNDNANGIISFKTTTLKAPENASSTGTHKVSLELQRTGGTLGTVSVIVRTVGGGEPWDRFVSPQQLVEILDKRTKDGSATAGKDYDQLLETVTFGPGVASKTVQLTIRDDDVPEADETVYLYLANVTGGAILGTTALSLQPWSVVTIEGNDLMNGEVGYVAGSTTATVDEDGSGSATLTIERTGANFGSVTVVWRVREPRKRNQLIEYQGTVVFKPGVKETEFTIRLRADKIPEFKDTFHVDLVEIQNTQQARINPAASSAVITVLDSDYPYGMVGFAPEALYTAVNLKTTEVSLEIIRSYGNSTDITVTYKTVMLPAKSTESGISTSQAVVGQDYKSPTVTTLKLEKGKASVKLAITLTPETPSDSSYPKAFKVNIVNVTNNAVINSETSSAMVIISNDEDTTRFLSLRASSRLSPLSDEQINKILADLKTYTKRSLDDDRLVLTKDTITNVLNEKKNRPLLSSKKLQEISKTTLMDIFDELLNPRRGDTKGRFELANLFDLFAYALAYGESCPTSKSLGVKGKYAYATAYRKTLESVNGLSIKSFNGEKHFFSYPSNMFIGLDNKQKSVCNDVHFIEYHTSHWFTGTVFSGKVLSTSLNDTSTINKNNMYPSTYRIYTGKKRVTPKGAKCVYWDFDKKEWSPSGCSVKSDKEDYVECQCNHMSNFAAQGQSDDRVGYDTYFFAACFVCLGAFALALLSHHACSVDNLFSAKLLMHMFFACMAAHLMYVVGAYVSSSQAVITEDPPIRCSVLGMFIHYFFLCQFSWMFIQGWNLWRILVLNDEHTDRKYVLFFVLGWGMPVVAIVLYIIIAQAAFSWSLHDMYGDVHKNGDMCFIPNAYAALGSVVAPTLLFLMGVAVVFTQAYQVTMQWRYYDDIYRGHYNIKEVRHIIILFILVSITWVFAGLHLAYGYLWMVILFAIFDVILGLYVFILFFILRNQVRGVFKRTYAFRGEPPPIQTHDDFFRGHLGTDSSGSKRFKRPSPEIPSDWDEIDNTPRSNRKLMVNMDDTGSYGQVNDNFEDDFETQDFDDLIFALKTGGHFDPNDDEKPPPDRQEHFELRRISIPDTHL